MSTSGTWQRRYSLQNSTAMALILLIMGIIFSVVGVAVATAVGAFGGGGESWIFMLIGGVFAVVGLGMLAGAYFAFYHGASIDLVCGPEGFTVTSQSRKAGKTEETYAWQEVTATKYYEERYRNTKGGHEVRRQFTVETTRGQAFSVAGQRNYTDLINLYNQMTPHLPYVWSPQFGYNFSVGPLSTHKAAYTQTPREPAENAAAAPAASGAPAKPIIGAAPPPAAMPAEVSGPNVLGIVGLVLSLVSLPMCGLLAPLGLLISIIGLFKPKKGLAIAGTVIGFAGSVLLLTVGWSLFSGTSIVKDLAQLETLMAEAGQSVREHRAAEGELPADDMGRLLMVARVDPYGQTLRYTRLEGDRFEIRSTGPDKQFDTPDDIKQEFDGLPTPSDSVPAEQDEFTTEREGIPEEQPVTEPPGDASTAPINPG